MSRTPRAQTGATLSDFLAIPEERRFHELIAGEIVDKAAPSAEHGTTQLEVGSRLIGPFGREPPSGGPGGWWFMTEVEVRFRRSPSYKTPIVLHNYRYNVSNGNSPNGSVPQGEGAVSRQGRRATHVGSDAPWPDPEDPL